MLTLEKVYNASYVLRDIIRRTDLIHAPKINPDCTVYLKPENLQITGSFKVRGSYYKISQLTDEEKKRGVIACSAGNHAQGVAMAATKNYGADVCLVDGVYDDAYAKALALKDEKGYTFIHPFDDVDVIAGQGTIGLELLEQMHDIDAVVVPIGGGGLISGVAFAIKSINPKVKVYGVQASGAPSMFNSIANARRERLAAVSTIADGIAVKEPGSNTFDYCRQFVDEIVTVNDDEISTAILALMEHQKLIAEGAGAVSVAAVMFNKLDLRGKKVVCVVSGGNIDVTILSRIVNRGMIKTGRQCSLNIELMDIPGQLTNVTNILAVQGANVISVLHDRTSSNTNINGCLLHITIETRDAEHVAQIKSAIEAGGYKIQ